MLTALAFEQQYALRSGITVERLRELGSIVAPCHCGDPICEGWQSIPRDAWEGPENEWYRKREHAEDWHWQH